MQLTINVTDADFGHELAEIVASLTPEEKKEIAREIFMKCLNETTDSQRTMHEKDTRALEKTKADMSSWEKDRYKTDDDIRKGSSKYQELMRTMTSAKEEAVREIIKTAMNTFKSLATEMVNNDEGLKKMWEATSEEIKADFPKYVHDAMTYFFLGHMSSISMTAQNALMQSNNAKMGIDQVLNRIGH